MIGESTQMQVAAANLALDTSAPHYDLSPEELNTRQQEMVTTVKEQYGETVAAVWMSSESPYADVVRTLEVDLFPEIPAIMKPYERECKFLALVDTRGEEPKGIVHAFRVSSPGLTAEERVGTLAEGKPNIAFIQDLVSGGEITEESLMAYYEEHGVDLDSCISVETNFRVQRAERFNGLLTSDLGYLAIFTSMAGEVAEASRTGVFAHLNRPAILSLGRTGIEWESVVGDSELQTPTQDPDNPGAVVFDPKYKPVFIPGSEHNVDVFQAIGPFAPPAVIYEAPGK
jgi:hypothetical protein